MTLLYKNMFGRKLKKTLTFEFRDCGDDKFISVLAAKEKHVNSVNFSGTVFHRLLNLQVGMRPLKRHSDGFENVQPLEELLAEFSSAGSFTTTGDGKRMWGISVEFGTTETEMQEERSESDNESDEGADENVEGEGAVENDERKILRGFIKLKGEVFAALRELSAGEARLKVELSFFSLEAQFKSSYICRSKTLRICKGSNGIFWQDWNVECTIRKAGFDWKGEDLMGSCSIEVTVPKGVLSGNYKQVKTKSLNRKMLQDGTLSDVTIVAGNGVGIKAHKCYLAAHSSKFATMLQQKGSSGHCLLELEEMTEEGIRALLNFLYCYDKHDMRINRGILIEFLQASYKYEITSLKDATEEMVIEMPDEKFGADEAVQLFLFARKLAASCDGLIRKATNLLKENSLKLEACNAYENLLKSDPKTAVEMRKLACGAMDEK